MSTPGDPVSQSAAVPDTPLKKQLADVLGLVDEVVERRLTGGELERRREHIRAAASATIPSTPLSSPGRAETGPDLAGGGMGVFTRALSDLRAVTTRPDILLEESSVPPRLSPYSFGLSATVLRDGDEVASGRFILLYDPAGHDAWQGNLRLVTLITAELEPDMADDPLLPAVAWAGLTDGLEQHAAAYTAIGGTITQTTSTRFGELAGPAPTADLEIRASWTPTSDDLGAHLEGWCTMLSSLAALPPYRSAAAHQEAVSGRRRLV